MLRQVYFVGMLAGNISGILRLWVMCCPPSHIGIRTPLSCSRAAEKSAKFLAKISFQMLFNFLMTFLEISHAWSSAFL